MCNESSRFACKYARLRRRLQRHATAPIEHGTVGLLAASAIVDPATVAADQAVFGAKPPNRVLHKPREVRRVSGVEMTCIAFAGDALDDRGATVSSVAAGTVSMLAL